MRGNVIGSQRQQDGSARNFERPSVPSRFSDREQSRGEADTATSWRKGQIIQRDKDQAVGQVLDNQNFFFYKVPNICD